MMQLILLAATPSSILGCGVAKATAYEKTSAGIDYSVWQDPLCPSSHLQGSNVCKLTIESSDNVEKREKYSNPIA